MNFFSLAFAGTAAQFGFVALSMLLGYRSESVWWLIPLTIGMAVISWLTDHYWKIRFYDIYDWRAWVRFWIETLFGLACFTFGAFALGRLLRVIMASSI